MSAVRIVVVAIAVATASAVVACRHKPPPGPAPQIAEQGLFTCCNLHYEQDEASDANYWIGRMIAPGTPVKIEDVEPTAVTFIAAGTRITLKHEHGAAEESFDRYLKKVFVADDPSRRIAQFSDVVRRAIRNGKVERGMTREQVVMSLGHPSTDATPTLNATAWTYHFNHWNTYKVVFDEHGKVADVLGRPAPTAEVEITRSAPVTPKKGKSKKGSKHKPPP